MQESDVTPRQAAQQLGIRLDAVYALLWAGNRDACTHSPDPQTKGRRRESARGRAGRNSRQTHLLGSTASAQLVIGDSDLKTLWSRWETDGFRLLGPAASGPVPEGVFSWGAVAAESAARAAGL